MQMKTFKTRILNLTTAYMNFLADAFILMIYSCSFVKSQCPYGYPIGTITKKKGKTQ